MKRKHFDKIKRLLISGLPSANELSLFVKGLVLVLVFLTFGVMFNYVSTAHAGSDIKDNALSGVMMTAIDTPAGCVGVHGLGSSTTLSVSSITTTTAYGKTALDSCGPTFSSLEGTSSTSTDTTGKGSLTPVFAEVDYGATGRVLNGGVALYEDSVAQPGLTVDYYASRVRGVASAADNPTSGKSVLAPIFFMNQAMVNLAYGLIAVVLVFSALNILLSSLTGAEEKFTLVQLLINAGVTLIVVSFYYEIAAIIYDLTVNYGNSLVASILSPFVNAQVILDRLSPGGDLSIIAVVNTFEFTGVSDGLLTVTQNIASGLLPAITQSSIAINKAITNNPYVILTNVYSKDFLGAIGSHIGLAGASASIGISYILNNFLGDKELFSAIIAWAVFFVNIKIFFNLLSTFITFCMYTAFGPMIALGGITGGFEKIQTSFKTLVGLGLVFPLTFMLILLGAISMNMFIRNGVTDQTKVADGSTAASILCKYTSNDPAQVENGAIQRDFVTAGIDSIVNGDSGKDDPALFRNRNYVNQRIFDVTPASKTGNVRDCRPSLFPVPFTFIPAPFGTIGNRQLQVQTIDSLVRTFLGIIFLILASRAPKILEEVLEIKQMGALGGLVGAFKNGTESFFAVGGVALGVGLPLASAATKKLSGATLGAFGRIPLPNRMSGAVRGVEAVKNYLYKPPATGPGGAPLPTFGDLGSSFTTKSSNAINAQRQRGFDAMKKNLAGLPGLTPEQQNLVAAQQLAQNYDKMVQKLNVFGSSIQGATDAVTNMIGAMQKFAESATKILSLDILEGP